VLRYFGAAWSASLLSALAVGWAVAALGQRAGNKKPLLALPFAAIGLVGLALMVVLMWENARGGTLLVGLSAFGAVLALALGAAGAGGDAPHGRAAALAAGAGVAAVFGCLTAIEAVETLGIRQAFGAVASAEVSMRASFLAEGVSEMVTASRAGMLGGIALLLAAIGLAVWAATRAKPSGGRIAGAVALVLFAGITLALDAVAMSGVGSDMERISAPVWRDVSGFEPIAVVGDGRLSEVTVLVAPDRIVVVATGASVPLPSGAPDARTPLVEAFRTALAEGGFAAYGDPSGAGGHVLGLAVDARVPTPLLREVLSAAREAGAGSVCLAGVPPPSPDADAALADLVEDAPLVAALLHPVSAVTFDLETAATAEAVRIDPVLFHATVDAHTPSVSISTRPGSPEPAFTIDTGARAEHVPSWDRPLGEAQQRVYLAFGDGVTAGRLALVVDHVTAGGKIPVVLTGPIPSELTAPIDLAGLMGNEADQIGDAFGTGGLGLRGSGLGGPGEGTIGLGNLGRIGTGAPEDPRVRTGDAEVRGSLSREVIRRIIRRHINEVRHCYEQALMRDPTLAGRVEVRFVIGPSGSVQSSELASSSVADEMVGRCITRSVQRWTFPAPDGGGIVVVTYPFTLEAG
jgi:TonB family protein